MWHNQDTSDSYDHGYTEGKLRVVETLESVLADMMSKSDNPTSIVFNNILSEILVKVKTEVL